jgi:hypothetical protein
VFYDNKKNGIKSYRAVEREDITIADTKIFNNKYLALIGEHKGNPFSVAVIGYEIKNGSLVKSSIVDSYTDNDFTAADDTLLENKKLSPITFITSKGIDDQDDQGFRRFDDEGFNIVLSKAIKFSFDEAAKHFKVNVMDNIQDWNKQAAFGVQYWAQLVMNVGVLADMTPIDTSLDKPESKISIENRKALSESYDATIDPPKSYYLNSGAVETKKMPAITQAKLEMWAKVINAKSEADVETIVHEWAQSCKNMGIDEIIAERQNFLDTFDISSQN